MYSFAGAEVPRIVTRTLLPLLAFGGLLVVSLALGTALSKPITPRHSPEFFLAIASDGWVVDGSEIQVPGVLPLASILELEFDHWRPGNSEPAHLSITLCDGTVREFLLLPEARTQRIRLSATCFLNDSAGKIGVMNPVRAGPNDSRMVGARLVHVHLQSPLGPPLLSGRVLLVTWALVLVILFLAMQIVAPLHSRAVRSTLVTAGTGFLVLFISYSRLHNRVELLSLLLLIAIILSGVRFADRLIEDPPTDRESQRSCSSRFLTRRMYSSYLFLLVLVASGLRFYGLNFGLPATFHPDEQKKALVISGMQEGDTLNPKYFLHPTLLLYSSYGLHRLIEASPFASLAHSLTGEVNDNPAIRADEVQIILAGRMISALAGTLSVVVLLGIGAQLFSAGSGIFAAAILAVSPLAITCSRYMKEDAVLLFFTLLSFYSAVRAAKSERFRWYAATALCVGFATGTKYSGLITLLFLIAIPLLSYVLRDTQNRPQGTEFVSWLSRQIPLLFGGILLVPFSFLLTTPYALLDAPAFLSGVAYERSHMLRGHEAMIDPWSQYWVYHLRRSLLAGMNFLPVLLAVLGAGAVLKKRASLGLVILGCVLAFYLPAEWVRAKPAPQPERYVLPCVAFLSLLISWFVYSLRPLLLRRIVLVLCLVLPTISSVRLASDLRSDTREKLLDWMRDELPRGTRIATDSGFYNPTFRMGEYAVTHIHPATKPWELAPSRLRRSQIEYVIVSSLQYDRYFSQPNAPTRVRTRYERLFSELSLVREVRPNYKSYGFHNPTLRVYRVDFSSKLDRNS